MEERFMFRAEFPHIVDGQETTVYVESDTWDELYTMLNDKFEELNILCAVTDFYTKKGDGCSDWIWMHQKRYLTPLCFPEFMFLTMGDHHTGAFNVPFQRRCIHIPSRQILFICHREGIQMGDQFINDPKMVRYNFKYVKKDGTSEPFVAFAIIENEKPMNEDEKLEFKKKVLKGAAKWFCEHLTVQYDFYFD